MSLISSLLPTNGPIDDNATADRRKFLTGMAAAGTTLALGTLPSNEAAASSMGVRPVRVVMNQKKTIEVFTVENRDADARGIVVQVLGFEWIDPQDPLALRATRNLLITPPTFRLAPRSYQKVRIGLRSPLFARKGANYRVIFRHLPEGDGATVGPLRSFDFKTAVNMNIPIYIR